MCLACAQVVEVPQGLPVVATDAGVAAPGPTVIPAVRGAPLLPRSLTVGRNLDKGLTPSRWPGAHKATGPPAPIAPPPMGQPVAASGGGFNVGEQVIIRENDETESAWIVKVLGDGWYAVDCPVGHPT